MGVLERPAVAQGSSWLGVSEVIDAVHANGNGTGILGELVFVKRRTEGVNRC